MRLDLTSIDSIDEVNSWQNQAYYILDSYVNRAVGCFGILVNLFFVVLLSLSNSKLGHKIYDFFMSTSTYKPNKLCDNSNYDKSMH